MERERNRRERIVLSEADRRRLERIRTNPQSLAKHVRRGDIILRLGDGCGLVELAMSPPPEHASHWMLRVLAGRMGIAVSTVFGILRRNGLKPHRVKTFKVSRDPRFEEKVRDVVGLCVDPPDHAVVISVDENTQIQALGRTQEPLPMKPGHPGTRTHDYGRNETTCLVTALDISTGKVMGRTVERHRSEEFPAFLDHVAGGIEPGTDFHVILDNVPSHKSAMVNEWLKDRPDWMFRCCMQHLNVNVAFDFMLRRPREVMPGSGIGRIPAT